jgi:hypothetical protein
LLAKLIEEQYGKLGGLATIGENAATQTGVAGQNSTDAIAKLLQAQGAGQAGLQLAQGNAISSALNAPAGALGSYIGLGGKF